MKRIGLLLVMMLLMSPVAYAEWAILDWTSPTIGGNEAVMIVDNGDDWSVKLNLRAEQRKGSEIRGRIYTGTRVEVYQDNGDWCTVGLNFEGGHVMTGEVMSRYLAPLEDEFSALCPLAVVKTEVDVTGSIDTTVAHLLPGDTAYVMAVCGDRYFVLVPGEGQGYVPANAFRGLSEPDEADRIIYRTLTVPAGGVSFIDDYTGEEVRLEGGVQLKDCWQIPGDSKWHVTYGAGIQRTPRVRGRISAEKLTSGEEIPFEGEVYDWSRRFIAVVGETGGEKILRGTDENGDIFLTLGKVPLEAELIDTDLCEIRGEAGEMLSRAVMDRIFAYVAKHSVLDERGVDGVVTLETAESCILRAAFVMDPATGELIGMRAWLEDEEGSYVTGGDLDPVTGEIVRWGCNA